MSRNPGSILAEGCLAFVLVLALNLAVLGAVVWVIAMVIKAVFGL